MCTQGEHDGSNVQTVMLTADNGQPFPNRRLGHVQQTKIVLSDAPQLRLRIAQLLRSGRGDKDREGMALRNLRWEVGVERVQWPFIDWSVGQGTQFLHNVASRKSFPRLFGPAGCNKVQYLVAPTPHPAQVV